MPDLIRNRVTERDIRDWLRENGYEGGSAVLDSVDLYAIKRPGWTQLFRFTGKVRPQAADGDGDADDDRDEVEPRVPVWGIVLDDERLPRGQRTQVHLCDSPEEQQDRLDELSVDMLKATASEDRVFGAWAILAMAALGFLVLVLIAMVRRLYE